MFRSKALSYATQRFSAWNSGSSNSLNYLENYLGYLSVHFSEEKHYLRLGTTEAEPKVGSWVCEGIASGKKITESGIGNRKEPRENVVPAKVKLFT